MVLSASTVAFAGLATDHFRSWIIHRLLLGGIATNSNPVELRAVLGFRGCVKGFSRRPKNPNRPSRGESVAVAAASSSLSLVSADAASPSQPRAISDGPCVFLCVFVGCQCWC